MIVYLLLHDTEESEQLVYCRKDEYLERILVNSKELTITCRLNNEDEDEVKEYRYASEDKFNLDIKQFKNLFGYEGLELIDSKNWDFPSFDSDAFTNSFSSIKDAVNYFDSSKCKFVITDNYGDEKIVESGSSYTGEEYDGDEEYEHVDEDKEDVDDDEEYEHVDEDKEDDDEDVDEDKEENATTYIGEVKMNSMLNGMFGKLSEGTCRLTMNGGIAVKTSDGYKTYDVVKQTLTNVEGFCFNVSNTDMFFVIPTTKVAVGDIILISNKPKCVIGTSEDSKTIKVIDYETSEVKEIVPTRHILMGSTYFYGKIVSMFGNTSFLKSGKGANKVIQMMMMSEMLGGNNGNNNNIMQMMMMSQMMSGENPFSGIFDGEDAEDSESK